MKLGEIARKITEAQKKDREELENWAKTRVFDMVDVFNREMGGAIISPREFKLLRKAFIIGLRCSLRLLEEGLLSRRNRRGAISLAELKALSAELQRNTL